MIYSRYGLHVEIVANYGLHVPEPGRPEMTLLLVRMKDPLKPDELAFERFRFMEHLKADDGWRELVEAVRKVHLVKFESEKEKLSAIQEAL